MKDRVPRFVLTIRWRLLTWRLAVESRPVQLMVLSLSGALIASAIVEPHWTLSYSRVLAWPAVALVALIAFRSPLSGLFQGLRLGRVAAGSFAAEFQSRDEEFDPSSLPGPAPDTAVPVGREAELEQGARVSDYAIALLVLLAQTYEFQVEFLRHMKQAPDGLVANAAEASLAALVGRPTPPHELTMFFGWLVRNGLLMLRSDGHYVLTQKGADLLTTADSFWSVPKAS